MEKTVVKNEGGPSQHGSEVIAGKRFAFGANWSRFLRVLDQSRIDEAKNSLRNMLGTDSLEGRSFLDAGSGSGLFSLAARLLGARVRSFDFDPQSVACTRALRERFFADDEFWVVDEGSVLDRDYLASLGKFDVVYSWGVLHHTGSMWRAMENVRSIVVPGGLLFISIYNDQGPKSRRWTSVKRLYCSGWVGKWIVLATCFPGLALGGLILDISRATNPLRRYTDYRKSRGMSVVHDWIDWLGGYPFEVAKPEQVFESCKLAGFVLERLTTCWGGHGCNEYVFRRRL